MLREVYVNRRLVQYEDFGKSESVQDGWRRISSLTVQGTVAQREVPRPYEKKLDRVDVDREFFVTVAEAILKQREEYDTRVYFYEYDPTSSPPSVGGPRFPTTQSEYWKLYFFLGTPCTPPPMG